MGALVYGEDAGGAGYCDVGDCCLIWSVVLRRVWLFGLTDV